MHAYILMEYKKENKAAVVAINNAGAKGKHLSVEAPKLSAARMKVADITAPMSREQQQQQQQDTCIRESKYCETKFLCQW